MEWEESKWEKKVTQEMELECLVLGRREMCTHKSYKSDRSMQSTEKSP